MHGTIIASSSIVVQQKINLHSMTLFTSVYIASILLFFPILNVKHTRSYAIRQQIINLFLLSHMQSKSQMISNLPISDLNQFLQLIFINFMPIIGTLNTSLVILYFQSLKSGATLELR